jgi:TonB-dependent SusC/RagA subfamily outer membrane receptor
MQKILIAGIMLILGVSALAQPVRQQWDRPMQLVRCSIDVKADPFTANTFIELEFYNPNKVEIEGLFRFSLNPGQAITAFQLDLNGRYRDGSIEEKGKATGAYNSIVGKRIDPALLTMDGLNQYSLRIYPIAPKSSRKVTMTIQQLMQRNKESIDYFLPALNLRDTVQQFMLQVNVSNSNQLPRTGEGLIKSLGFQNGKQHHRLHQSAQRIVLNKPIAFHLPLPSGTFYCTRQMEKDRHFALSYKPRIADPYAISPKTLTVFWDVSASGNSREISREINFLKQYLAYHKLSRIRIVSFNYRIQDTAEFYTANQFNSRWDQYLAGLKYDGATQLGCLDFSADRSDAILIFSDGNSSYGKDLPKPGSAPIFCIGSNMLNKAHLDRIIGESGGERIDLSRLSISEAVRKASNVNFILMDIRSASGRTIIEHQQLDRYRDHLLMWGTMGNATDSLIFEYGNNSNRGFHDKVFLDGRKECPGSGLDRLEALHEFDGMIRSGNWQKILLFGKEQKMVTPHTAYLVLERIEDYITYNIEPPKELEKECAERNYVKRDNTPWLKQSGETEILQGIASFYNHRIKSWNAGSAPISIPAPEVKSLDANPGLVAIQPQETGNAGNAMMMPNRQSNMDEVVVVGYGMRRKDMTSSVTTVRTDQFAGAASIEQALQGRVAGLSIQAPQGYVGNGTSEVRIRGLSSINNSQPLYVLDGLPIQSGDINDVISLSDIESITVHKDASATALFGSRAANGVIAIESKKGKRYHPYYPSSQPYKLNKLKDVDYLRKFKQAPLDQKINKYRELQESFGSEPGFYFDVARHLYEIGYHKEAIACLTNAAEVSGGNLAVLKATGFVLEEWKEYDEALLVFEQVRLQSEELSAYRNLALVHYLRGEVQKAIDLIYMAITRDSGPMEYAERPLKAMMLAEMNAMIALNENQLNLSGINPGLIKPLPVDLRIVVDGNLPGLTGGLSITEPGKIRDKNQVPYLANHVNEYYYNSGIAEFQRPVALPGKYLINLNYYDRSHLQVPAFVRITSFKNFGKKGQSIEVQNVIMDNQNGLVEIGEVEVGR